MVLKSLSEDVHIVWIILFYFFAKLNLVIFTTKVYGFKVVCGGNFETIYFSVKVIV